MKSILGPVFSEGPFERLVALFTDLTHNFVLYFGTKNRELNTRTVKGCFAWVKGHRHSVATKQTKHVVQGWFSDHFWSNPDFSATLPPMRSAFPARSLCSPSTTTFSRTTWTPRATSSHSWSGKCAPTLSTPRYLFTSRRRRFSCRRQSSSITSSTWGTCQTFSKACSLPPTSASQRPQRSLGIVTNSISSFFGVKKLWTQMYHFCG